MSRAKSNFSRSISRAICLGNPCPKPSSSTVKRAKAAFLPLSARGEDDAHWQLDSSVRTVGACLRESKKVKGLLSPTLSSKGGEGAERAAAFSLSCSGGEGWGRGGRLHFYPSSATRCMVPI